MTSKSMSSRKCSDDGDEKKKVRCRDVDEIANQGIDNGAYEGEDIQKCDRTSSDSKDMNGIDSEDSISRTGVFTCLAVMSSHKGAWYTLCSAAIISVAAMAIRHLSSYIGANEIAFTRMVMQLVVCVPVVTWKKVNFRYSLQGYALLLLRSILGSINTCLVFFTFTLMPVANAKAIQYSCPIFAGLLGWVLLKEACSFMDAVLALITLTGVMLVAQPPFLFDAIGSASSASPSSVLGAVLSLFSAFLSAVILIVQRKLAAYGIPPLGMLTVYSLTATGFTALLTSVPYQWVLPRCGIDRIFLIGNGLINFFSQILIYMALKYERASNVSLYHSSDVLFSFVLEFAIFGVVPNWITIVGTLLIIASFVGITGKQWFTAKNKKDDENSE